MWLSHHLEKLPNYLIVGILDQLYLEGHLLNGATVESVVAFGLSSLRFWPFVLERIHQTCRGAISQNWAGKQVSYHSASSHFSGREINDYKLHEAIILGYGHSIRPGGLRYQ